MSKRVYTWVIKGTADKVNLNDYRDYIQQSYNDVGADVVVTTTSDSYTISGNFTRGQCIVAGQKMAKKFYQYGKKDKNGIIHIFQSKLLEK